MNKRELVEAVAAEAGLTKSSAAEAVNAVLDVITNTVATGEKVSITGFGSFEQVHKPARAARNPSTGAEVEVAESWAPKFRPGSDFKELVNINGRRAADS
ncbi:HU family DNA-binding protein [Nonomuraea endophytica]|uniref:DNA-binding protein HU-beta n=1 Tax=Nonomuraea endophytica TaxID=714136 RepID=A0A7W8A801_9ACTN|nr:HU family DNA-binding protein [Nonomuraea endophytica]MBB5081287.1 DNA-binding protein HU-beta [Nonomuraea endophytica]